MFFLIILVMMMVMMIWLAEFGEADEPGAEEDGRHWEDKVGDCDDDRQVLSYWQGETGA